MTVTWHKYKALAMSTIAPFKKLMERMWYERFNATGDNIEENRTVNGELEP